MYCREVHGGDGAAAAAGAAAAGEGAAVTEDPPPLAGTGAGTAVRRLIHTMLLDKQTRPVSARRTTAVAAEWFLAPCRKKQRTDWTSALLARFTRIIPSWKKGTTLSWGVRPKKASNGDIQAELADVAERLKQPEAQIGKPQPVSVGVHTED